MMVASIAASSGETATLLAQLEGDVTVQRSDPAAPEGEMLDGAACGSRGQYLAFVLDGARF